MAALQVYTPKRKYSGDFVKQQVEQIANKLKTKYNAKQQLWENIQKDSSLNNT